MDQSAFYFKKNRRELNRRQISHSFHDNELPLSNEINDRDKSHKNDTNTLWKNLSNIFKNSKPKIDASAPSLKVNKSPIKRLSTYFKHRNIPKTAIPLNVIGFSPNGYQLAFSLKSLAGKGDDKKFVMGIKLPKGSNADDVAVTIEFEAQNGNSSTENVNFKNDTPLTIDCIEETESHTIFSGNLKLLQGTDLEKLMKMPMYLINSKEKFHTQSGTKIVPETIVKSPGGLVVNDIDSKTLGEFIKMKIKLDKCSKDFQTIQTIENENDIIKLNGNNSHEISSSPTVVVAIDCPFISIGNIVEESSFVTYSYIDNANENQIPTDMDKNNKTRQISDTHDAILQTTTDLAEEFLKKSLRNISIQSSTTHIMSNKETDIQRNFLLFENDSLNELYNIENQENATALIRKTPNTSRSYPSTSSTLWPMSSTSTNTENSSNFHSANCELFEENQLSPSIDYQKFDRIKWEYIEPFKNLFRNETCPLPAPSFSTVETMTNFTNSEEDATISSYYDPVSGCQTDNLCEKEENEEDPFNYRENYNNCYQCAQQNLKKNFDSDLNEGSPVETVELCENFTKVDVPSTKIISKSTHAQILTTTNQLNCNELQNIYSTVDVGFRSEKTDRSADYKDKAELRSCLSKINKLLVSDNIDATMLSSLEPSINYLTKLSRDANNVINRSNVQREETTKQLSEERQQALNFEIEKNIERTIEELMVESKNLKQTIIDLGIREISLPFVESRISEKADEERGKTIEDEKSKIKPKKKSKDEFINKGETKKHMQTIINELLDRVFQGRPEEWTKNVKIISETEKNRCLGYFCDKTTFKPKIPKTSYSFGEASKSTDTETPRLINESISPAVDKSLSKLKPALALVLESELSADKENVFHNYCHREVVTVNCLMNSDKESSNSKKLDEDEIASQNNATASVHLLKSQKFTKLSDIPNNAINLPSSSRSTDDESVRNLNLSMENFITPTETEQPHLQLNFNKLYKAHNYGSSSTSSSEENLVSNFLLEKPKKIIYRKEFDDLKKDFVFPNYTYKSREELNSPQEVAVIDESLSDNKHLSLTNLNISKSTTPFDLETYLESENLSALESDTSRPSLQETKGDLDICCTSQLSPPLQ